MNIDPCYVNCQIRFTCGQNDFIILWLNIAFKRINSPLDVWHYDYLLLVHVIDVLIHCLGSSPILRFFMCLKKMWIIVVISPNTRGLYMFPVWTALEKIRSLNNIPWCIVLSGWNLKMVWIWIVKPPNIWGLKIWDILDSSLRTDNQHLHTVLLETISRSSPSMLSDTTSLESMLKRNLNVVLLLRLHMK